MAAAQKRFAWRFVMAEKQSGTTSALTNNSLFSAVLAVAGALYLNSDALLEKLLPDAFETCPISHAYHDIEAGSWQDPLAAAEAYRQTDAHGPAGRQRPKKIQKNISLERSVDNGQLYVS